MAVPSKPAITVGSAWLRKSLGPDITGLHILVELVGRTAVFVTDRGGTFSCSVVDVARQLMPAAADRVKRDLAGAESHAHALTDRANRIRRAIAIHREALDA